MAMQKWVRLPSAWIEQGGLKNFQWKDGGSDNTSALMALVAIAHRADQTTGVAKATYTELCTATDISRAKLSKGLGVLEDTGIIQRWEKGRSSFQLVDFDPAGGWCQLPAKPLYHGPVIEAFRHFRMRNNVELNAMRLYLLFAARRGRDTNLANISLDRIVKYTGIRRHDIKAATTVLASLSLAYIERVPSTLNDYTITATEIGLSATSSHC